MAFTKTTTRSYGKRLTDSLKAIVAGALMFVAGTILLFWNEGNFVETRQAIDEAQGMTINVEDVTTLDAALNGKLIHATAFADTQDILSDELFGISTPAIRLSRKVQYYQWQEESESKTRDKIGGGEETVTTYTYSKAWSRRPVDSGAFEDPEYRDKNFVLTRVEEKEAQAETVTFGAYRLPRFIIEQIWGNVPAEVNLSDEQLDQWREVIAKSRQALDIQSGVSTSQRVHASGNMVYLGLSPDSPQVGDVRITLTKVLPADISIIAQVNGASFESYTARNGREFDRVAMGRVSATTMFDDAHSENDTLTWVLRLVGTLLVIGSLKALFSILPALFKVLPFLGNIVGAGVGLVCFVAGLTWSLLVIAVAWLFYRPLIGIALLALVVGGIWYLKKKSKANAGKAAA